jgi:hypothetical protein
MPLPIHKSNKVGQGIDIGSEKRRYSPPQRPGNGLPTHRGRKTGQTDDRMHGVRRYAPKKP